jgi:hypothetical protein
MATPRGYRWNPTLKRYIAPNGRIVGTGQVRSALDEALRNADVRTRALAEQLRSGSISLAGWEREMRIMVKDVQLYGAAAAAGGWAQLTPSALGRVGSLVREQYDRLYQFTLDVATGRQRLDGTLTNRATLYSQQGRRTFYKQMDAEMSDAGFDEERNVLGASEHCDECVEQTSRGWVEMGSLVPIGERTCLSRCNCAIEYRRSASNTRERPTAPRRRRRSRR